MCSVVFVHQSVILSEPWPQPQGPAVQPLSPTQRTLIPPLGPLEYIWLGFCRKELCGAKHDAIVDNFVPKNPLAGGGWWQNCCWQFWGKTASSSSGVRVKTASSFGTKLLAVHAKGLWIPRGFLSSWFLILLHQWRCLSHMRIHQSWQDLYRHILWAERQSLSILRATILQLMIPLCCVLSTTNNPLKTNKGLHICPWFFSSTRDFLLIESFC